MKILINLIGGQPAPVYIGIRSLNPDLVIQIYSIESKFQLDRIKNTLANFNYEEVQVHPYDYDSCRKIIKSILSEYDNDEVIVNLTSGTKIMSLAAFNAAEGSGKDVIYIDSQNHSLIKIKGNDIVENFKINLIFSVKDYFLIYGYPIEIKPLRLEDNETFRNIRNIMLKHYSQIKNLISEANKQISNKKTLVECKDNSGQNFLRYNFKKTKGILNISQGRQKINFEIKSQIEFDYITGLWFEDYIFLMFKDLKIFDDIQQNVKIYTLRENLKPEYLNEFDICAIKDQTLYIFECKTGNIDKNIVEKLRLIKSLTGTYSNINLITLFRPLETTALERIRDFKIGLITFNDIDKFIESFKIKENINPNL
ncbi:MAG TPA: DUF1887 family CARF protein [Ignavibacteria bacterium]|nr:hypothetical protein [Bacteroidota bacterium]HRI85850.1 DUF1887 family CARF protein [Ignavibacteria bacterium]HRK00468.1 DUF1887 family CARF protein [Ignavibacteria bacterium]